MKSTQKYILSGIRQLIDLNKDITNFDLNFSVTSTDGSDFEALVVDQNILDTNPNPEYKKAPGTISGNIISDKGIYQNYFLLLKCDPSKSVECEVTVDLKEIPINPDCSITQPATSPREIQENFSGKAKKSMFGQIKSKFDFKFLLLVILAVAALAFIYFKFFKEKSDSKKQESNVEDSGSKTPISPIIKISPASTPVNKPKQIQESLPIEISSENKVLSDNKRTVPQITIPKISSTPKVSTPNVRSSTEALTEILPEISSAVSKVVSPPTLAPVISNVSSNINSDLFKRLKNMEITK